MSRFEVGNIPWNKGMRGIHLSPDTEFKKGHETWNKGTKGLLKSNKTSFKKGHIPWHKGKKVGNIFEPKSKEVKMARFKNGKKLGKLNKGKKLSLETKKKLSESHLKYKDRESYKSMRHELKLLRERLEYRIWRNNVFERDDFTCRKCSQHGGKLIAHHIKSFTGFPDLRHDINNGLTVCEGCHKIIHWGVEN